MMKPRYFVISISVVVLCVMGVSLRAKRRSAAPIVEHNLAMPSPAYRESTPAPAETGSAELPGVSRSEPPSPASVLPGKVDRLSSLRIMPPSPPQTTPDHDPDARKALSLVGTDPSAEMYWAEAINDPNLPDEERQNLIEDLNEDGLSDPTHPSAEDLRVIVHRMELIETLAPNAMDQVNAEAFAEAYKDLSHLLASGE